MQEPLEMASVGRVDMARVVGPLARLLRSLHGRLPDGGADEAGMLPQRYVPIREDDGTVNPFVLRVDSPGLAAARRPDRSTLAAVLGFAWPAA